jgi:zinc/manganese transport system ATP-binding protein
MKAGDPVVVLERATMRYGTRVVFDALDLRVEPGEFIAVLGPNGSGKTTLLKALLGLEMLSAGTARVLGTAPRQARHDIGYVPQQHGFDRDLPIRGRDLVQLGVDGHRWGLPIGAAAARARVDVAIAAVGAQRYAGASIGTLSGGEQQRLRIAQAIVGDPKLLLCDEPLLSLDISHQQAVTQLIDARRREANTAVLFVTHEINPVLPYVDRILYLVGGRWMLGTPAEVLTSERLSDLYGTTVDVLELRGRIVVIGADDSTLTEAHGHHHHLHDHGEHDH